MAYELVLTSDTPTYPKGTILTDINDINRLRMSEYALQAVQVSDTVIPPPEPPPPPPDLTAIQLAVQQVAQKNAAQDSALQAATAVDATQSAQISAQAATIQQQNAVISDLNTTVGVQNSLLANQRAQIDALAARVSLLETNPPPTPVDPVLADDVPLAEADNVVLATNAGVLLGGDVRGTGLRP